MVVEEEDAVVVEVEEAAVEEEVEAVEEEMVEVGDLDLDGEVVDLAVVVGIPVVLRKSTESHN